jgi:hypothetical protein
LLFYRLPEEIKLNKLMSGPLSRSAWVCSTLLLLVSSLAAQETAAPEAAAAQAATEAATLPPPTSFSNKWRMEISGNSKSAGSIVLRITPKGGASITAEVAIADKKGENDVAKALVKGLQAQLDKKAFHIERDDGEDVLVKKKGRTPDFALQLVSSSVEHTRIHIEKE